jgi:uncharacterized protein YaaN involved in tellurite resistance
VKNPEAIDNDSLVPFVLKDLPQSRKEIQKIIKKYASQEEKPAKTVNLIIARLRDYHDPLASGNDDVTAWNLFVMALLDIWMHTSEDV